MDVLVFYSWEEPYKFPKDEAQENLKKKIRHVSTLGRKYIIKAIKCLSSISYIQICSGCYLFGPSKYYCIVTWYKLQLEL